MLKHKKSKVQRMRGTSSHGWGHKKKHRGKGHRGGVGLSGSGARGDAKKPSILTAFGQDYFGKKGFSSIHKKKTKTLSLSHIESSFDVLVEQGIIVKEKGEFVLDTTLYKYNKVLGRSTFTKKITLICDEISASAKTKVEEAGGKVIVKKSSEELSEN